METITIYEHKDKTNGTTLEVVTRLNGCCLSISTPSEWGLQIELDEETTEALVKLLFQKVVQNKKGAA